MIRPEAAASDAESRLRLDPNALEVLEKRYLERDDDGRIVETPSGLFRRVARAVAEAEARFGLAPRARREVEEAFHHILSERLFLPNSPTLMNAGRRLGMLSACFVLPLEDSIPEIMETARQIALVQRAGGGTGVDLSRLRPAGSIVRSSGGTTEGPLSFLRMLSSVTDAIQQGAFRRGANMGMMRIDHPDILAFTDLKSDLTQVTNYNLSVSMTDEFMERLAQCPDTPHEVVTPHTGQRGRLRRVDDAFDPIDDPSDSQNRESSGRRAAGGPDGPNPGDPSNRPERVSHDPAFEGASTPTPPASAGSGGSADSHWTVREVWERIVRRAHATGEPGLIFIDEVNRANQTPHAFEIRATNPCGEQPLGPYEACNLGSVNLAAFWRPATRPDPSRTESARTSTPDGGEPRSRIAEAARTRIDWEGLETTVRTAVRFLDDVVEINRYPTPEIHAACHANRKIGLGVMGFADLLFRLGVRYDSDDALDLARHIGRFIQRAAHDQSRRLAGERGTFPNWPGSVWERKHRTKMRNAHTTTIAPTGTISIIAGCSGGIEPIFSLAFTRQVLDGKRLREVNPVFRDALERAFEDPAKIESILEHAATHGSVHDLEELPAAMREIFRTARDIAPSWHVRMQAAWQEHTDAAVSKTINLPSDAAPQAVEDAYLLAYETRCKGITVYRDGSRPVQPMALDTKESATNGDERPEDRVADRADTPDPDPILRPSDEPPTAIHPVDLPEIMPCVRIRQTTPFGNMHVKISVDPHAGVEREVFAQLGKGGDLANSDLEAVCRLLSLFLRCNGELERATNQLAGIGSSLSVPSKEGRIRSLADGLAHAIRKYLRAKERFGLESLLLGKVALEALEAPSPEGEAMSDGTKARASTRDDRPEHDALFKVRCPECAAVLAFEEGCVKCHACGFSQC